MARSNSRTAAAARTESNGALLLAEASEMGSIVESDMANAGDFSLHSWVAQQPVALHLVLVALSPSMLLVPAAGEVA